MKESVYKNMKITIFEKAVAGVITESERNDLLAILEEKKACEELTDDCIKKFFDDLVDKYPNVEDDVKKLQKKLKKADDEDEGKDEDESDDKEDDDEAVSEAAVEIYSRILDL